MCKNPCPALSAGQRLHLISPANSAAAVTWGCWMGRQLGGAILRLLTMNRSEHGKFVTAPGELILLRRARARALTVGLLLHTHIPPPHTPVRLQIGVRSRTHYLTSCSHTGLTRFGLGYPSLLWQLLKTAWPLF